MTEGISALRRRMIEDRNARGLSAGSQRAHSRSYKRFAALLGRSPETASREDIRRFQLHLAEEKVSITIRNAAMSRAKCLFRVTLRRLDLAEGIYHLNEPKQAPLILRVSEIKRLLAVARPLKAKVLLSTAYGTGMRAGVVVRLKVGDIDSDQMIIRVGPGQGQEGSPGQAAEGSTRPAQSVVAGSIQASRFRQTANGRRQERRCRAPLDIGLRQRDSARMLAGWSSSSELFHARRYARGP